MLLQPYAHRAQPAQRECPELVVDLKGTAVGPRARAVAALLQKSCPGAVPDLVARLSVLTDDLPELASIELNPVNAWSGGVDVLGAEVVISRALVRKDTGRRSLT